MRYFHLIYDDRLSHLKGLIGSVQMQAFVSRMRISVKRNAHVVRTWSFNHFATCISIQTSLSIYLIKFVCPFQNNKNFDNLSLSHMNRDQNLHVNSEINNHWYTCGSVRVHFSRIIFNAAFNRKMQKKILQNDACIERLYNEFVSLCRFFFRGKLDI